MNLEIISIIAIICPTLSLFLHVCMGEDVSNAIGMEPHCTITWELSNQISAIYTSKTVDIHVCVFSFLMFYRSAIL